LELHRFSPRTARRDGEIEFLRAEANRLKSALVMREKEIVRLRAEIAEFNKGERK
jgi:hypothetical protein